MAGIEIDAGVDIPSWEACAV